LSAGKPGSKTSPEKAPANATVKKIGITSDGTNVDGRRGISFTLLAAIPHPILAALTAA
jgi:hypothetical protein